ncbi:ABC transporter substrate-binding protein [Chloroflexota bacterium]
MDATIALRDGRVKPEGIELNYVSSAAGDIFRRMRETEEFDVSEMSISNYVSDRSKNDTRFIAIPVFTRMFRHSYLYINKHAGINNPQDLKGKKVGITKYASSGALWLRGILQDDYGVTPEDIRWFIGGKEGPKKQGAFIAPESLSYQVVPTDKPLHGMLEEGELDGLMITVDPPWSFKNHANVGRLWPDFRKLEIEYYRKTGLFPVMHTLVFRQEVYEANPQMAVSLFKAFSEAKKLCGHLDYGSGGANMLPWSLAAYEDTVSLMGEDFYPYGVEPNRKNMETIIRFSKEQGLSQRNLTVDELFATETLDLTE